ncbi:hypothetical protein ACH4E7_26220 [Kitasatospora sp. NPDC018058]|uniref:hypothetical protein n=1 Tax=Kitasatospora sp. NPDC018058 TaxID=3364025 RepID=UPI0037BF3471
MGDGQELVPGVVGALVRLAQGTAGGPGQAVAEVVWARLRLMPDGAPAVAALEASPDDPRAREGLTAAVTRLLAGDVAFAQYVATTELGRPADPTTVRLRVGPMAPADPTTVQLRMDPPAPADASTVQLRVDPAVANARALAARRSNTGIIVALALVLIAALVGLGINLGSRPLLHPNGPDFAHAARTVRDPAQLQGVLPDVAAMPGGWQVESAPESGAGSGYAVACLLPDSCDQQLAYATVTFHAPPAQSVKFTVVAFASAEAAGRAFATGLDRVSGPGPTAAAAIPPIGDQSTARTRGSTGVEALVRVGPTLLYVRDDGPGAAVATPALVLFARLLVERARQAQDGRTPDAAFHADVS